MTITISHCRATIDPAATVSDADFPAVFEDLERQYTTSLLTAFPDADIEFWSGDGTHSVWVSDDADGSIAEEVKRIMATVYEQGRFWNAASQPTIS